MNETKDIKGLESLYGTIIENEDNKVWKKGDCPEALGDSEHAHDLKPEEPCSTSDEECVTGGKPITPESNDDNDYYMNKISERLKENEKKSEKMVPEQINNSVIMSDEPKNIFDKLYDTIMEGDDPFADLNGMDAGLEGDDVGGDEELDLGGDEVTLNLPRDMAEQLCDMLKDQLGEDGEDEDGGDDFDMEGGEDEMLGDAVVSKPDPAPAPDGVSTLTASNNKTSGSGYTADGSSAEGGNVKENPTPSDLGHGNFEGSDHPYAGDKKNKVNNPKTKALGD